MSAIMCEVCPKVSVIIPVYNVEPYLGECLDSIINQTIRDIEIICIDDGSTDRSLSILSEYAKFDNRITILCQKNAGAGAARNKGLEIAKGEYLAFLDSDDVFELNMLEKAYFLGKKDEADIVIYKVQSFDTVTKKRKDEPNAFYRDYFPSNIPFSYNDMPQYIFNTFQNWAWNKLFKRSFVKNNNLHFQEIKRTNDLFFVCMALISAKRITLLDEVLVYYRCGTQTNCQANNHEAPLDFYHACQALRQELINRGIYKDVERSFINLALNSCMYNLNSLKDAQAFEQLYTFLRNEGFASLGILDWDIDVFYVQSNYRECQNIINMTPLEYLFNRRILLHHELDSLNRRIASITRTNSSFDYISYRIGRFLTYIPRTIIKVMRFLKKYGLKKLLKKIIQKLIHKSS